MFAAIAEPAEEPRTIALFKCYIVNDFIDRIREQIIFDKNIVNITFNNGLKPLHVAIKFGRELIINLLLKNGANVNEVNLFDETSLSFLIKYEPDNLEQFQRIFIKLLNSGADVNRIDSLGNSLLVSAIQHGTYYFLTQLLIYNACDDIKNNDGDTVYHYAIKCENYVALDILLKHYANPNIPDKYGRTPLFLALYYSKLLSLKIMLRYNVKFDYICYFNLMRCDNTILRRYDKKIIALIAYNIIKQLPTILPIRNSIVFRNYFNELYLIRKHTPKYFQCLNDDYKRSTFYAEQYFPNFLLPSQLQSAILLNYPLYAHMLFDRIKLARYRQIAANKALIKLQNISSSFTCPINIIEIVTTLLNNNEINILCNN